MAYAYLDKYCILHVVEEKEVAENSANWNGKVVETDILRSNGFPLDEESDKIIVEFENGDIQNPSRKVPLSIIDLVKQLV